LLTDQDFNQLTIYHYSINHSQQISDKIVILKYKSYGSQKTYKAIVSPVHSYKSDVQAIRENRTRVEAAEICFLRSVAGDAVQHQRLSKNITNQLTPQSRVLLEKL
jgi:hypothetical protein